MFNLNTGYWFNNNNIKNINFSFKIIDEDKNILYNKIQALTNGNNAIKFIDQFTVKNKNKITFIFNILNIPKNYIYNITYKFKFIDKNDNDN